MCQYHCDKITLYPQQLTKQWYVYVQITEKKKLKKINNKKKKSTAKIH